MESPQKIKLSPDEIEKLLDPRLIRERAGMIFSSCEKGATHFSYHPEKLSDCAAFVAETIKELYPNLEVPFHSRFRHFEAGNPNRVRELLKTWHHLSEEEQLVRLWDLCIVSVYLDAGAGEKWSYKDKDSKHYTRSEGLGVATFNMFVEGLFSRDPQKDPCRVDAEKLEKLDLKSFELAFQSTSENPLLGVESRFQLIKNLAVCMSKRSQFFTFNKELRPGNILRYSIQNQNKNNYSASKLLSDILIGFQDLWPKRLNCDEINFGDCWHYSPFGELSFNSLMPFHKLSQWLCYSLLDPLQNAGYTLVNLSRLTGLPEYRNGGLLLDEGVIQLRDNVNLRSTHDLHSDLIIEWRALTIVLLDKLGDEIRTLFKKNADEWPLVKILEGGTWHAGRKAAMRRRGTLNAPLKIASDGTVF